MGGTKRVEDDPAEKVGTEKKEEDIEDKEDTKEDGEDEECGFCKFMKAGPCGDVFEAWERCIDKGRKDDTDYVESCIQPTKLLKECMEKNPEYYGPMLEMEKEELETIESKEKDVPSEEPSNEEAK